MFAVAILAIGLSMQPQDGPYKSGCEQCHLVLHEGRVREHVANWTTSEHAARRVACVRCHDGDAAAADPNEAHRFVTPGTIRTSPVHPRQLPQTCGWCHPREASQFMASPHGAALAANLVRAPSCAGCHEGMSARGPTPAALETACARCHQGDVGREQFPSDARVVTEWLATLRERLATIEPVISRVADDVTRRQRWTICDRAERRLDEAVGAIHRLDLAQAASLLSSVRVDISELEKR